MSSAWSVKGSGGRRGGASGWVRAARSVAVRSSRFSVATQKLEEITLSIRETHEEVQVPCNLKM